MELSEISGTYDAIFSLGMNCGPAIHLEVNGLRHYTGVIDWMTTKHLSDVNAMIRSRFAGFALKHNLVFDRYHGNQVLLRDTASGAVIVHDFLLSRNNTQAHWPDYDSFRVKLERRIERFLHMAAASRRMLFIRVGGRPDEADELEQELSQLATGEFHVLLVNYAPVTGLVEEHWPHPHTCAITMSDRLEDYQINDAYWRQILARIKHAAP